MAPLGDDGERAREARDKVRQGIDPIQALRQAQTDLEDLPEALGTHVPREIVDLLDTLISDDTPAAGRIARWLAEVVRG